jgi:hypothetical protein
VTRRARARVAMLLAVGAALVGMPAEVVRSEPVASSARSCHALGYRIYGRYRVSCRRAQLVVRRWYGGGKPIHGWRCGPFLDGSQEDECSTSSGRMFYVA